MYFGFSVIIVGLCITSSYFYNKYYKLKTHKFPYEIDFAVGQAGALLQGYQEIKDFINLKTISWVDLLSEFVVLEKSIILLKSMILDIGFKNTQAVVNSIILYDELTEYPFPYEAYLLYVPSSSSRYVGVAILLSIVADVVNLGRMDKYLLEALEVYLIRYKENRIIQRVKILGLKGIEELKGGNDFSKFVIIEVINMLGLESVVPLKLVGAKFEDLKGDDIVQIINKFGLEGVKSLQEAKSPFYHLSRSNIDKIVSTLCSRKVTMLDLEIIDQLKPKKIIMMSH